MLNNHRTELIQNIFLLLQFFSKEQLKSNFMFRTIKYIQIKTQDMSQSFLNINEIETITIKGVVST